MTMGFEPMNHYRYDPKSYAFVHSATPSFVVIRYNNNKNSIYIEINE